MKPLSRQRLWQIKQKAAGNCTICGQPGPSGFCPKHRDFNRTLSRNRYRKIKGIPLDAPVKNVGRARIV